MKNLPELFASNRAWAARMLEGDPEVFRKLTKLQAPEYLWIGCSDSRVPANEIVDLAPGELFVHRNVANVVVHTDLNCLAVLQFAVDVLHVRHVIVCGHYGCGGVKAALERTPHGLVDHWLRHVRDVRHEHRTELDTIDDPQRQLNRLCELNVIQQVRNVAATPVIQEAWRSGKKVAIHAWIYDLHDGLLRELADPVDTIGEVPISYRIE